VEKVDEEQRAKRGGERLTKKQISKEGVGSAVFVRCACTKIKEALEVAKDVCF